MTHSYVQYTCVCIRWTRGIIRTTRSLGVTEMAIWRARHWYLKHLIIRKNNYNSYVFLSNNYTICSTADAQWPHFLRIWHGPIDLFSSLLWTVVFTLWIERWSSSCDRKYVVTRESAVTKPARDMTSHTTCGVFLWHWTTKIHCSQPASKYNMSI